MGLWLWRFVFLSALAVGETQAQSNVSDVPSDMTDMNAAGADSQITADAQNAAEAALSAKVAAQVANHVAVQSMDITKHTRAALRHAQDALHMARVEGEGLSDDQQESLKRAEGHLSEAAKRAEVGHLREARYVKAAGQERGDAQDRDNKQEHDRVQEREPLDGQEPVVESEPAEMTYRLGKLQDKLDSKEKVQSELTAMRETLDDIKRRLTAKHGMVDQVSLDDMLKEAADLEELLNDVDRKVEAGQVRRTTLRRDELKAEIEKLRAAADRLVPPAQPLWGRLQYNMPSSKPKVHLQPLLQPSLATRRQHVDHAPHRTAPHTPRVHQPAPSASDTSHVDIDTQMPFGELEPFGREDTAQELTESSIKESDEMVDQLERAEVAEEKRAVFRALTRLRGAAITSYDGIARAQTGNIDQYSKTNQWRQTHPVHHLAREESDVSKWAFPDMADF